MIANLNRWFPLNLYNDPVQRRRAIATYIGGILLLFVYIMLIVVILTVEWEGKSAPIALIAVVGDLLTLGSVIVAIHWTRRGRQHNAGLLIMIVWSLNLAVAALTRAIDPQVYAALMVANISIAALLIDEQAILLFTGTAILIFVLSVANTPTATTSSWLLVGAVYIPVFLVQAVLNYVFSQSLSSVAQQVKASSNLDQQRLTDASSTLTQQLLATRLDLDLLLKETIKLVKNVFAHINTVQLYLIDKDRRNATLLASTEHSDVPIGKQIGVGTLSVVGRVSISGQTVVVRATSDSTAYRRSAFLQGTRAEVAIPLRVATETIGVLDIQSTNAEAFGPEETKLLETLVNQIAIAVDNARLYGEGQAQLSENKRLYEQAQASLQETRHLNQQLTGKAWTEYLRRVGTPSAYTLDLTAGQIENAAEWTSTLAEAARRNQPVIHSTGQAKIVALPINVRGQVIGAMEFEVAPDQPITPDQLAIIQQVIERFGLAAENTRLLEEAQRSAQREAIINEISTRIQSNTSVEGVLTAVTQSLADTIRADRVAIRLGSPVEKRA